MSTISILIITASNDWGVSSSDRVAVVVSSESQTEVAAGAKWSAPVGRHVLAVNYSREGRAHSVADHVTALEDSITWHRDTGIAAELVEASTASVGIETAIIITAASSDSVSNLPTSVLDSIGRAHCDGVASVDGGIVRLSSEGGEEVG